MLLLTLAFSDLKLCCSDQCNLLHIKEVHEVCIFLSVQDMMAREYPSCSKMVVKMACEAAKWKPDICRGLLKSMAGTDKKSSQPARYVAQTHTFNFGEGSGVTPPVVKSKVVLLLACS